MHQVAECNHNNHVENLCDGRVKAPYIHHDFEVEIVEQEAADGTQEIAEKLVPFFHKTARKNHIPGKIKTKRKGNKKGKDHGRNVRADGYDGCMNNFFFKGKIVAHKKNHHPKGRIATSTGRIPECLKRHPPPEERVKKQQDARNEGCYHIQRRAKVAGLRYFCTPKAIGNLLFWVKKTDLHANS